MATQTVVISTRVPAAYARSLRRIAELRCSTMSDVVGKLIVEQVAPFDGSDSEDVEP